ncbi:MAG: hypothetical protein HY943_01320 [Gammaproteobacteria bacterium]|nr:hypothetical protein [Gammaproteobacteria bacterium]
MQKRNATFLSVCLAACFTTASAAGAVVYSENFDDAAFFDSVFIPAGEVYAHNDRIGWANTGIGYIKDAAGWTFANGAYLAMQEGTADHALWLNEIGPGATKTIDGLTVGQQYEISFLQWGDDFTNSSFTGNLDVDGTTILSYDYTVKAFGTADPVTRTAHFTATRTTATLIFGASSGGASPIIDGLRVSSVPLPPALPLFAAAMVGLRRRNKKAQAKA